MAQKITALAVAALAAGSFYSGIHTAQTSPRHQHSLVFTALASERTETFVRATPSGGKGDSFIEHEVLRDGAGTHVVGEVAGNCLTVNSPDAQLPPALVQCTFTYLLPEGQITTQGLVPRADFQHESLAVTGGTGRYATAGGQVDTVLSAAEDHDNTITIHLH